ncbi:uncharacterized protein LOC62_06G008440 [Vanrija pseudolonga]|uniref:RING-type domain-containing protein n=1 Tax=Vanrija pseudolonga TaxID=143232 RepID=A0AAF0YI86_9TREE|nr:hypothetical protein LOC62_06G008440 [Vanrija pseudolonga]
MRPRLEDVACAICMESLFTAKDDLDEVMPVAAPDCGHVLHEKCLLEWFDSQIQQFISTAHERGWEHERDPGPEDVPVECPQCRTEVYGDDDGKPLIHRLYVNFGEASAHAASSSQMNSSPVGPRATQHWGNPVEREALGLARRARNAADEIGALGAQSNADEMNGTLRRVGKLREDVLSAKASQGFKAVAINNLRDKLESDPTVAELRADIERLKSARANADSRASRMETIGLPQAHQAGVMEERKRAERFVAKAQMERDTFRRELDKEKVAREAFKRAVEEREAELRRQLEKANNALQQSHAQTNELKKTLQERTGQLKLVRSKLEQRKGYKDKIASLEEENQRLREEPIRKAQRVDKSLDLMQPGPSSGTRLPLPRPSSEAPPTFTPPRRRHNDDDDLDLGPTPRTTQDESLFIEEPWDAGIALDLGLVPRKPARSTTARSFKMDLDNGLVKDKKSKGKSSKYFASADPPKARSPKVLVADSSPFRRPSPRQSPYSPPRRYGTSTEDAIELSPSPRHAAPLRTINRESNRQSNFLQDIGVVDANGRPRKTLATGVRVRPGKL